MDVLSVNAQEKDGGKQQRVVARWFRKNDNWDVSTAYPFAYLLALIHLFPTARFACTLCCTHYFAYLVFQSLHSLRESERVI